MAHLFTKLFQGSAKKTPEPEKLPHPMCPPSPAITHLTGKEIDAINEVLNRNENFEKEHTNTLRKLEQEVGLFEDRVRLLNERHRSRSPSGQTDLQLCRLCYKTKFADGIGRLCHDCQQRVCNRCGSFTKNSPDVKRQRSVKGRWRCLLCQKRRELNCVSGKWFHGAEQKDGDEKSNYNDLKRKLSDVSHVSESDWGYIGDREAAESSDPHSRNTRTDSEAGLFQPYKSDTSLTPVRRNSIISSSKQISTAVCTTNVDSTKNRKASSSSSVCQGSTATDSVVTRREDDEDLELDDEQFHMERQKCRRERLERLERKQTKKKWTRSPSDTEHTLERRQPSVTSSGEKSRKHKPKEPGIDVVCQVNEMDIDLCMLKNSFEQHSGNNQIVNGCRMLPQRGDSLRDTYRRPNNPTIVPRHRTSSNSSVMSTSTAPVPGRRKFSEGCNAISLHNPSQTHTPPFRHNSIDSEIRRSTTRTLSRAEHIRTTDAHGHRKAISNNVSEQCDSRIYRRDSDVSECREERIYRHRKSYQRQHSIDRGDSPSRDRRPPRIVYPQSSEEHYSPPITSPVLHHHSHKLPHHSSQHTSGTQDIRRSSMQIIKSQQVQNYGNRPKMRRSSSDGDPPPGPPPPSPNSHKLPDFKQINMFELNASVENLVQKHALKKKHSLRSIDIEILEDLVENEDDGLPARTSCSINRKDSYGHRYVRSARTSLVDDLDVKIPEIRRHSDTPNRTRRVSREDYERFQSDRLQKLTAQIEERNQYRKASDPGGPWASTEQESANAHSAESISSYRSGNSGKRITGGRSKEHLALDSLHSDTSLSSLPPEDRQRKLSSCAPFKVVLQKDESDKSCRTAGLGMRVVGGKMGPDGCLGAFVTYVIKGGPADQKGICEGDQIMEWDGSNLEDTTFDESRQVISRSGHTVQLVVMHTRYNNEKLWGSNKADSKRIPSWHMKSEVRKGLDKDDQKLKTESAEYMKSTKDLSKCPISGQLSLRLTYSKTEESLKVGVKEARDLMMRSTKQKQTLSAGIASNKNTRMAPDTYAMVYMLPSRSEFSGLRTDIIPNSTEPRWDAVFLFNNFSSAQLKERSIEVTLWDHDNSSEDRFLGEVLLDLSAMGHQGESELWYLLQEHDENSSSLPIPGYSAARKHLRHGGTTQNNGHANGGIGNSSSELNQSLPHIPATPAHDKVKELLTKRNTSTVKLGSECGSPTTSLKALPVTSPSNSPDTSRHFRTPHQSPALRHHNVELSGSSPQLQLTYGNSPASSPVLSQSETVSLGSMLDVTADSTSQAQMQKQANKKVRKDLRSKMKRQVSDVMSKVGAKLVDKRTNSMESSHSIRKNRRKNQHRNNTISHHTTSRKGTPRQLSLNDDAMTSSRTSVYSSKSSTSWGSMSSASDNEDLDILAPDRPSLDGDDFNSMLGPGQLPPKPAEDKSFVGDLSLGFMITKGQLEVNVNCAKSLVRQKGHHGLDTYAKTFLLEGKKRLQKKHTKSAKGGRDPFYKQQIKYSACNVHGRHMQIQIKEKSSGFEKNPCIGEVIVNLDSLDLSRHNTGWYKMFRENAVEFRCSNDSLNF